MDIKELSACNWNIIGEVLKHEEIDDESGLVRPEVKRMSKVDPDCYKVKIKSIGPRVKEIKGFGEAQVDDITFVSQIVGASCLRDKKRDYRSFPATLCVAILKSKYPKAMEITPLNNRVLVQPIADPRLDTKGLKLSEDIFFGDDRVLAVDCGKIIAVGAKVKKEEFEVGDIVFSERDAFCKITSEDQGELRLIYDDRILYKTKSK